MVDVSAAAAVAALEQSDVSSSQVVPEQYVQQFENAMNAPDGQLVDGAQGVEVSALGDRMMGYLAGLDRTYQDMFPNGLESTKFSEIKLSNDGMATEAQLRNMVNVLQDAHAQGLQVSLWATQVNLVTTMVGKSTQGVQTLFKNSG